MFERADQGGAIRYRLDIYLADRRHLRAEVGWDDAGGARFEPAIDDAWALAEATKLARVLHRDPKARMTRWRGPEAG